MLKVIHRIVHSDQKKMIEFFENGDGTVSFDEWSFSEEEMAWVLLRPRGGSLSRTSSVEESLREAKGRIPWLAEMG
jgi:hypothetical protein